MRPVQGDALFKSSYLTPIDRFLPIHISKRDWDYLQFLLMRAFIKRELKVTVSVTIYLRQAHFLLNGMACTVMIQHGMENSPV